jgi:DNA/RNA endonuclease YhcR with UshA esterase domain
MSSTCPSCGRDAGTNELCPHCGADLKHRVKIRTFGIISVVVAVVGVAILLFFASRAPVPTVNVSDIQSTSNYAYVQLHGLVSRGPNYNPDSQSITFWLRDDTGEIMVSSFRDQTQELIAADKVPAPGDTIALQGTLRVRDGSPSLTIDSADAVTIVRATAAAEDRPIGSLTPADDLKGARIVGMVRQIKEPYPGLKLITLRDATGAIDVAIPTDFVATSGGAAAFGVLPSLAVNQPIEVLGAVTLFEDTPQLTVRRGADITPLQDAVDIAKFVPLTGITDSYAGQWARTQGEISRVSVGDKNTKLTLSDGDRRLTVLIWPDAWEVLPQADFQPGAQISVQGEVSLYRDELEIVPELPSDLEIVARVAPAVAQAKPIGSITADDVKSLVVTQGTIEQATSFSSGSRYDFSDPSGMIVLLVWNSDIDPQQQQEVFKVGATLSVTGEIDEFNGQLEIVPRSLEDVTPVAAYADLPNPTATPTPADITQTPTADPETTPTVSPTSTPAAASTPTPTEESTAPADIVPLSAISKDHVGQTFTVRGKVVDTSSFSAGFKFVLDDGTGRMSLTLFDGTYKFVPNRAGLNLGADVQVTGEVAEFQGVLELQPDSGRDVQIITPGSSANVPVTKINELGKPGELVAIEGTITDVKGFSAGANVFVDDGTGNARVTLFNNVMAYVPQDRLVPGAAVRVYGKLGAFGGALQIVPALGYDVIFK